jgi:hypothetical protein
MIQKLNRALTVEIVLVASFIGLAFRSFTVMLASVLPGIFPILASGAVLWALGEGLQFASVVALTVSFGLGLSATIHFLNRLRLEDRPGDDPGLAVEQATVLVGPALILTSRLDPHLGGARLRARSDGVLQSAVLAPLWLAQRLRHDGGPRCRPLDPATDRNLPPEDRPVEPLIADINSDATRQRAVRAIEIETCLRVEARELIVTVCRSPRVWTDKVAEKSGPTTLASITPSVAPPDTAPRELWVISVQVPWMVPSRCVTVLLRSKFEPSLAHRSVC